MRIIINLIYWFKIRFKSDLSGFRKIETKTIEN